MSFLREATKPNLVIRSLAYSHGAQPTPVQPAKLSAIVKQAAEDNTVVKSAIVTPSSIGRGVATALQWFHRDVLRAFAPADLEQALSFLGLKGQSAADVKQVLRS